MLLFAPGGWVCGRGGRRDSQSSRLCLLLRQRFRLQRCIIKTSAAIWGVPWPGSRPCRERSDPSDGTSFDHFGSLH